MKNLIVRTLSGAVYVALITASIIAGPQWFFILLSLFAAFGVVEIDKMVTHRPSIVATVLDIAVTLLIVAAGSSTSLFGIGPFVLVLVLGVGLFRVIWALWDRRDDAFRCVAGSMLAIVYLGVPLMLFNFIYFYNKWLTLGLFALIWFNDTGAYVFGSWLGKHKLFERLSPKKSWEGFFGGMLSCIGMGIGCYYISNALPGGLHWPLWLWPVYAVVVCVFATLGDLFESLLKRSSGIKDSGNIIPGHGGILDRIDSMLFVVPATVVFLVIYEFVI